MATQGIGVGLDLLKVGLGQLAQHTARLKNARDENSAMDALIPAFDADLMEIVDAYNSGDYSASDCIAACLAVDRQSAHYLAGLVGKPGTSWNGPTTEAIGTGNRPSYQVTCNRGCTASCCVYLNNLRPAIFGRGGLGSSYAPWQTDGVIYGIIELLQKGGGTLKVITVVAPPHQYGSFARPGYTLELTAPSPALQLQEKLKAITSPPKSIRLASGVVLGGGLAASATTVQQAIEEGSGQILSPNEPLPASGGILSSLTSSGNDMLLIVGVFFAVLLAAILVRK